MRLRATRLDPAHARMLGGCNLFFLPGPVRAIRHDSIPTASLTARQLHHLGDILPAAAAFASGQIVAVNPAICPNRQTIFAWLNSMAPCTGASAESFRSTDVIS